MLALSLLVVVVLLVAALIATATDYPHEPADRA